MTKTSHSRDIPDYLAPKRPRRAYGDKGIAAERPELPAAAATRPSLSQAIEAMLAAHALDWATTHQRACRGYLLSPTGRFQAWCRAQRIVSVDDLTTELVRVFLGVMLDRQAGVGLKASTVAKYRILLRALAHFQAQTPGYGDGLADIDRIRAPRMARETYAPALSREEEERVVLACATRRDRLVIELFLATGIRVSEMAGLLVPNVLLAARPPRVAILGSVHDPECTKSGRPRQVPFRRAYDDLPRRLASWIQHERDPGHRSRHQELFLGDPRQPADGDGVRPLGIAGFERLCHRVSQRAGVHFSPHILRHTWATRMVDAGVKPIHLMAVGGWNSVEMVRRYYTANAEEILAAIAAAGA